ENDAAPHFSRQHTFTRRARWPVHDIVIGRVETESECGRTVGHEIDPEDLRCDEREDESVTCHGEPNDIGEQYAEEPRHDLADVRREQIPEELADVGED